MKTNMSLKRLALIAALGSLLAVPAFAQNGSGMGGGGKGGGPCMQGGGGGGMRFNQKNTPGWKLMTPEERTEMQTKMRAVKTYDECKQLQTEHRTLMETRAKEKGVTLNEPRRNGCDRMKAKGLIK